MWGQSGRCPRCWACLPALSVPGEVNVSNDDGMGLPRRGPDTDWTEPLLCLSLGCPQMDLC